jgi:hypothetical protein
LVPNLAPPTEHDVIRAAAADALAVAKKQAWKEYQAATAPAQQACYDAMKSHCAAREYAIDAANRVFSDKVAPIEAEFNRAIDPARKAYHQALANAAEAYDKAIASEHTD